MDHFGFIMESLFSDEIVLPESVVGIHPEDFEKLHVPRSTNEIVASYFGLKQE